MELQFYSSNMDEYNAIFDLLPFSVYWKDTECRYVGRNRFAAEQMVLHNIESEVAINFVYRKTDFDLFDNATAEIYRANDIIVINDPNRIHYFVEYLKLPLGDHIEQICIKRGILDANSKLIGTLSCTININKFMQPEGTLKDLMIEEALKNLRILIIQYMGSKTGTQYHEICDALIYLIYFYPNDHELRRLLLLTQPELHCLCLLLKGFSTCQIGSIINKSSHSVEIKINNIQEKLNLTFRLDLIDWLWKQLSQL